MLEKLFESLDDKVFTTELKESLSTSFNEAVEVKAIEIAASKVEERETELVLEAKAKEKELVEKAESDKAELLEQVDAYLEKVVEEFVVESEEALSENLKAEKADLMIESFDAHIVACGVDVQNIVEAKDSSEAETKLAESVEKYDTLIEDNIELEKMNSKLIKMGVIAEMKSDLTLVEAEKFAKLAELVEFSKDATYAEKLDVIKESVKGTKEEVVTESVITEGTKVTEPVKAAYSHLV